MANKKLKVGGCELKLPTKKAKGEKKPKWRAKTGKKAEPVVEAPEVSVETTEQVEQPVDVPATETQPLESIFGEAMPTEPHTDTINYQPASTETTNEPAVEPTTDPEPAPKKNKKLMVKADLKPKKLSMINAALQVLQQRKIPMTCPELIDVLATEDLWTSPGGKTPAATLYAAIGRSIKDLGKASPFRKTERGKFEVKVSR